MKPSIFVVEDDPDISRLVRHHLEGAGFQIKLFPTGHTVLAESERQRPALFILCLLYTSSTFSAIVRRKRRATESGTGSKSP